MAPCFSLSDLRGLLLPLSSGKAPLFRDFMEDLHVVPINDLKPHFDSSTCPCMPRLFVELGRIWIHNSWDGREITERAIDYVENSGRS